MTAIVHCACKKPDCYGNWDDGRGVGVGKRLSRRRMQRRKKLKKRHKAEE